MEELINEHLDEWDGHLRQLQTETLIGNKLEQAYMVIGEMSNMYQELERIRSILDEAGIMAQDDGIKLPLSSRVAYAAEAWRLFKETNNADV